MTSILKRDRDRDRLPSRGGSLGFGPTSLHLERDDRRSDRATRFRRLRRLDYGALFAWVLGLGTIGLVAFLAYKGTRVHIKETGLKDDASYSALGIGTVNARITFTSADDAAQSKLSFDGKRVKDPDVKKKVMSWKPPADLAEGKHRLTLSVPRAILKDAKFTWEFTYDTTPPKISAPPVVQPVGMNKATVVRGRVEPDATLRVGGRTTEVDDDGSFKVTFKHPPAGAVVFEAVDPAGNRSAANVVIPVTYPEVRAVHVTAAAWSNPGLRGRVLQMVDEKRINTVVLDLKNEDGVVGYDTDVARAHQVGAVTEYYRLENALETLKQHSARMIGRISAFRDPKLAQAAWNEGRSDEVLQKPTGGPYSSPAQFTNFANADVQQYNLDIALDAVRRGVHDIMWDDVRRPGADPTSVVVPGLPGSAGDALVGFLANAHNELRRRGAYQGVDVPGISVNRGDLVGQDIGRMARHVDYMVPTIHPAYWDPHEFNVDNPVHQPYDIVNRVTVRFAQVAKGSGVRLVPSLQDFNGRGVGYGDGEIRAEIQGAHAAGARGFLMWDPSVTYTATALDPKP